MKHTPLCPVLLAAVLLPASATPHLHGRLSPAAPAFSGVPYANPVCVLLRLCGTFNTACCGVCPAGTLPPSWAALTKLRVCNLWGNKLSGPLPGSWSGMAAMEELLLSHNALTGEALGHWQPEGGH